MDIGVTPYITRDLMECDLIKQERDIQKAYITSLNNQIRVYPDSVKQQRKQTEKYKARSKRRGNGVAILAIADVLLIAFIKIIL